MSFESATVNQVGRVLDKYGAWWIKTTGQKSKVGCPDIIACYRGYFIGMEIKPPDENYQPSKKQQYELGKIQQAGGKAHLIRSAGEAEELLWAIDTEWINLCYPNG